MTKLSPNCQIWNRKIRYLKDPGQINRDIKTINQTLISMKRLINNEMYTFSFYVHSVKTLDTKNLKVGPRRISLSRKKMLLNLIISYRKFKWLAFNISKRFSLSLQRTRSTGCSEERSPNGDQWSLFCRQLLPHVLYEHLNTELQGLGLNFSHKYM